MNKSNRRALLKDLFSTAAKAAFSVLCLAAPLADFGKFLSNDPHPHFPLAAAILFASGLALSCFLAFLAYYVAKLQDFENSTNINNLNSPNHV